MATLPVIHHRRATVGSPPFSFSNTFESHRPSSRADRLQTDFPYRTRRSTVSGHAQGHNVNYSRPLVAHEDVMLSDSASSSPILSSNTLLFPSPRPSSAASPRTSPFFEYDPPSFSLCPSPDFPSHLGYPRLMPPLLPADFSDTPTLRPLPSSASASASATTPALSPTNSSPSFPLDPALIPSPRISDPASENINPYRQRIQELETELSFSRMRVMELEAADNDNKSRIQTELGIFAPDLPPPPDHQWPMPPDWYARTEARLKRFCAVNRAGNALCAWHDSRRERRAHPPRMAPPNTLNCGCTYEQALFEESLSRNRVGAYHPGESVRMDPALRNPLLELLQRRYGYRDGDFERRADGTWKEGEDAQAWERACATRTSRRDRS